MKALIFSLLTILACAVVVVGCGAPHATGPLASEHAKTILVAVDRSKSMYLNDPTGFWPESLQVMFAMAPPGSRVGVVAYSDRVEELTPMTTLSTKKDRERVAKAAASFALEGKTDFEVVFQKGMDLFSKTQAPKGASMVLVTDGQHNRGDTGIILDTAKKFEQNDWQISAMAFTPQRKISFLETVTHESGGEAYKIDAAEQLLDASLNLSANAQNMFAFVGDLSAVTILPGTEYLLMVALKDTPDAGFLSLIPKTVTSESMVLDRKSPSVYAYPPELGTGAPLDIFNVWDPASGLWEIQVQGTAKTSHILCNLPVKLSFVEGSLKNSHEESEPVGIAIEATTDNPELFDMIKQFGGMEIVAEPVGAGNTAKEVLALSEVTTNGRSSLLFSGNLYLFAGGKEPVEFKLKATLTINCPAGGCWLYFTDNSVGIKPGGSAITAEPDTIDFGLYWTDEGPFTKEIEVSAVYPGEVAVVIGGTRPGLTAEPAEFTATKEERQKVTLTLNPSQATEFGALQFPLLLDNTILANNSKGVELPVPISAGIYKMEAPEEIKLAAYPGKDFVHPVPVAVTPPIALTYEPLTLKTELEDTINALIIENPNGGVSLGFSILLDAPDGVYTGELRITSEIADLAPRVIKVILSISGTPQLFCEPQELKLTADKTGWVEQTLTIWAEHFEKLDFEVAVKDILSKTKGLISGQYDIEFVPLEGWDGKKLEPGKKYKANLRFFVSSDLQSGTFEGETEISITYRDGKKVRVSIPVGIEISR